MPDDPWLLVRYRSASENTCLTIFKKMGIEAYLPRVVVTITHARTAKTVPRPLFPGYLFLRDSEAAQWYSERLSGVIGIVRNGQKAWARLAHEVIQRMQRSHNANGFIELPDQPLRGKLDGVRRGDPLAVNIGGEWWLAEFVKMRATDRVVVMLRMFGTTKEKVVGLHVVEKAMAVDDVAGYVPEKIMLGAR